MAISKLHRLSKTTKLKSISKDLKKTLKSESSKKATKIKPIAVTKGPSCLDNSNIIIESSVLEKAIDAFKNRDELEKPNKVPNLLEDSSGKPIYLQFSLQKLNAEVHIKPLQIKLNHSIYSGKDVCIFVKDPQKSWKKIILEHKIPEVKKVIGVTTLRKKYKTYEDRRLLCNSFDLFLCDKAVACSLPSLLGKYFIEKKKLPISVSFSKTNMRDSIIDSINSTYYKLTNGSCVSVKVALSSMPHASIIENINTVLDKVKKFHTEDKTYKNHINTVFLNWGGSDSLPLYSHDIFNINDILNADKI